MGKKPKVSAKEAIRSSFPRLAEETRELSKSIGALAGSVTGIESSVRRIGLNVSAWHEIAGGRNDDAGYAWSRDIGYTRIGSMWHIAIREWSQEVGERGEQTI